MKLFDIGPSLRKIRKDQKITQEQLAKQANISRVTLGKIERGQMGAVSVKTLDIILDTLGLEISFKQKNGFGLPTLDELVQI